MKKKMDLKRADRIAARKKEKEIKERERSKYLFLSRLDELINQNERVGDFLKEAKKVGLASRVSGIDFDKTMSRILVNYPEMQLKLFLSYSLTMLNSL